MNFKKRYENLNSEQRQAVNYTEGPLMVVAGPGTGKTEVLGMRASNILEKTDTPPGSVLCLTYTDAASVNMRERLIDLIGEDGYKIPAYTFHGFCKKIMESYPEYFFKGAFFSLADDATKTKILEDILGDLDHLNPLSSIHPQKGYVYLESVRRGIAQLKESGLTVNEFREVVQENKRFLQKTAKKIDTVFSQRVSGEIFPKIKLLIKELRKEKSYRLNHTKPLAHVIADSLEIAIEDGDTKKVSQWKRSWTKKEKEGRILKNLSEIEKMESLANIYEKYRERMYEEGYYEFLDMLLDVALEIESNESLKSDLQEKYLYFLVDEFQDTNGIQMRILNLLAEDKNSNICVVGDDDQAIYRFQGAEISNILDFREIYPEAKVITLLKSYRSKQKILDMAREVILKGEERLENFIKEVEKKLVSQTGEGEEVFLRSFKTKEEEYAFIARKVKERIGEGVGPEDIAVIGRTHKSLKNMEPFFSSYDISVYSERKENVFEKEHVRQIITILRFSFLFLEKREDEADELLPEILSFPFWGIKREKVLEISIKAHTERKPWLICMKEDDILKNIANFLLDISLKAKNKSLEEMVDIVIGTTEGCLKSPFKEYYFSKEKLKNEKSNYLNLLSSLKCFVRAVREYKAGKFTKVKDLVDFLEVYEKNNIPLLNKNPLVSQDEAVSLITAHSAKGKEFDTVFVLNCQKEEWGVTRRGQKISLPANMPFRRAGDEDDDRLRLFYVALSRAKNMLYLVSYEKEEDGRNLMPLEFLSNIRKKKKKENIDEEDIRKSFFSPYLPPFYKNERELLFPLVKKYKLSATGLNKFLNVAEGGPQAFLEENILYFPKKKALSLSYGTAVHSVITETHVEFKKTGKIPNKGKIISLFENYLKKERLSKKNEKKLLKQGREELALFYKIRLKNISPDDIIEKNFKNEDCVLDDIEITGKIDKIVKKEEEVKVFDFKTGKPLLDWKGGNDYEKIKVWKYKNQLIFYKFLIEGSREFKGKYFVESGALEFVRPTEEKEIKTLSLNFEEEDEERLRALIKVVGEKIKRMEFPSVKKYKKATVREIKRFEDDLLEGKI